jgi:hypothetical protein
MNRFRTFIIFLILVVVWALFFATIKFFLWGDLSTSLKPNLQDIAGYLSLGWIWAFLVGWAFAHTFLKKYYLFAIALLTSLFILYGYIFSYSTDMIFAVSITFIGFLYGLWNVMKSVIISIEIKKTGLPETAVTAIVGMMFVLCIIIGSLVGNIIYENMWHSGYLLLLGYLIIAGVTPFFLDYESTQFRSLLKNGWWVYIQERKVSLIQALQQYIPDISYIARKYGMIIITSSVLWSLSTIISQITVEYSADKFGIKNSEATMILLYSALWAIVGSFLSIKMNTNRWFYFLVFNILFAITVFLAPIIGNTFFILSIMAGVLGMCFGTAVNLSDSYLLKCFGEEDKKEYGASTMGLIFSTILFVSMFVSSRGIGVIGYQNMMYIFSIIILIVSGILYIVQSRKV